MPRHGHPLIDGQLTVFGENVRKIRFKTLASAILYPLVHGTTSGVQKFFMSLITLCGTVHGALMLRCVQAPGALPLRRLSSEFI